MTTKEIRIKEELESKYKVLESLQIVRKSIIADIKNLKKELKEAK